MGNLRRLMKKLLIVFLALTVSTVWGQSDRQNYLRAARSAKADLDKALEKYGRMQKEISDARIPISRDLLELRREALSRRREMEQTSRLRDARTVDLQTIEKEIEKRETEVTYLTSLLGDYVQRFENQLHISERAIYRVATEGARMGLEDPTLSDEETLMKQIEVVQLALGRIRDLAGGVVFEGSALSPGGAQEKGDFALVGPLVYFSSSESDTRGFVFVDQGSAQPSVIQASGEDLAGIGELTTTKSAVIPIDPSLVNALKLIALEETFVEHVRKGRFVGYCILALAALSLAIAIYKWIEISGVRRARPEDLQEILGLLEEGKRDEALAAAKGVSGPVGLLLTDAVEHSEEGKDLLEEVLYERLLQTQPNLEKMIPFIAVVAATAPLMGLLGTVTGMINTFQAIQVHGTGDARVLSSGISEALVTTEFGLCVAIPSIIIHALLLRRTRGVLASMEQTAVAFKNGLETKIKG